eukprot:PLAT1693.1.p1 GENE.PLAT1693.1~~PLAT1693.1.p1  ORF type:complete len:195 (+),score=98.85 PLAT1693.1:56-640(+)
MLSWSVSRTIGNVLGYAYPAYASFKAVQGGDEETQHHWLTYWVVMGLFTVLEMVCDVAVSWLPLYWELKIAFVIWLALPHWKGATRIYDRFLAPNLQRYEGDIDSARSSLKTKLDALLSRGMAVIMGKARTLVVDSLLGKSADAASASSSSSSAAAPSGGSSKAVEEEKVETPEDDEDSALLSSGVRKRASRTK